MNATMKVKTLPRVMVHYPLTAEQDEALVKVVSKHKKELSYLLARELTSCAHRASFQATPTFDNVKTMLASRFPNGEALLGTCDIPFQDTRMYARLVGWRACMDDTLTLHVAVEILARNADGVNVGARMRALEIGDATWKLSRAYVDEALLPSLAREASRISRGLSAELADHLRAELAQTGNHKQAVEDTAAWIAERFPLDDGVRVSESVFLPDTTWRFYRRADVVTCGLEDRFRVGVYGHLLATAKDGTLLVGKSSAMNANRDAVEAANDMSAGAA